MKRVKLVEREAAQRLATLAEQLSDAEARAAAAELRAAASDSTLARARDEHDAAMRDALDGIERMRVAAASRSRSLAPLSTTLTPTAARTRPRKPSRTR